MNKAMELSMLFCIVALLFSCEKKPEAGNNEQIAEIITVDTEINGITEVGNAEYDEVYEITSAYAHLYNNHGVVREIETEKLGSMITIENGKAVFSNEEYEIISGNGYAQNGILEYKYFLFMFAGLNYGIFDENIIGKDYTGTVKAMALKNEKNAYYIFFADNKLIIQIDADKHETEFEPLIRFAAQGDSFFYIAEKTSINPSDAVLTRSKFIIDENGMITGYNGAGGDLVIPSEIEGKPVRAIGDRAFRNKGLTSVAIPSTVISIGEKAFWWNNITSVTIPNSVNSIGNGAFWGNQLTSVVIPNSVRSIGDAAFYVNKLTEVTIPRNIISISDRAFRSNQLTKVIIPDTVTSIGKFAFDNNKLASVSIPGSVKTIGADAFYRNNLTTATIPTSVTTIGNRAFGNNQLTSIIIPGSITNIDSFVFVNNKLKHITISEGVATVGYGAFSSNQLTSVTMPTSLKSIEGRAFYDNQLTSIAIPDGLLSIADYAFIENQLVSVTLGNAITHIGEDAFDDRSFLIQYLCNNKKAGIYKIGSEKKDGDFDYIETEYGACITAYTGSERNSLLIPNKLNGIDVKGTIGPYEPVFFGQREDIGNILRGSGSSNITHVTMPDGLVYIGEGSFKGSRHLTSVYLPSSLRYIGNNAFGRSALTEITIPDGVISIDSFAFSDNKLTSVVIPDSVIEINFRAFDGNDNLTNIKIGSNVSLSNIYDSSVFENDFDNFYRMNGMKAGTYTFNDGKWNVN